MLETEGFTLNGVSVELGGTQILRSIDITIEPGEFVAVVGPNGSGKSTLIKLLYGAVRPSSGNVFLDGKDVSGITQKRLAQRIAVVAQERDSDQGFSVYDVVALGRIPHSTQWLGLSRKDEKIIVDAMERVDLARYRHRNFATLSGGEKQRALLARTIAQEPEYILLDEPTNHLDIHYQFELMAIVKSLDVTVVAALHDLNMVARDASKVVILSAGQVHSAGATDQALSISNIADVFAVEVAPVCHPRTQQRHLLFDLDETRDQ